MCIRDSLSCELRSQFCKLEILVNRHSQGLHYVEFGDLYNARARVCTIINVIKFQQKVSLVFEFHKVNIFFCVILIHHNLPAIISGDSLLLHATAFLIIIYERFIRRLRSLRKLAVGLLLVQRRICAVERDCES